MKNIAGMIKLGCTLAVYAAVACVMLAFVYTGTSKIIAIRVEADQQAALKDIFPDADSFEPVENVTSPDLSVTIQNAYLAKRNGTTAGMALRLSRAGYSGPIVLLVGVGSDKRITGVKIMEHSDTPGLGANAASPTYFVDRAKGITFYGQFAGKSVSDPFAVKDDIVSITASTITSRAVAAAVKAAGQAASEWLSTGGSK
ncbi:MAG: RnfABCDGE type electron transport complex subunit G [Treponema sp.]|jgi:electron transport complex protein RnfG|nr:RnfABCDGE type electron transport complex subunit G [Treponema sp.]